MPEEKKGFIPRPPTPLSVTDFIVTVFVVLVASILFISTMAAVLLTLFTDKDVHGFITVIIETMQTLMAALIGYLAGKGVAKVNGNGHRDPEP